MKRQIAINVTYDEKQIEEIVNKIISRHAAKLAKKVINKHIAYAILDGLKDL